MKLAIHGGVPVRDLKQKPWPRWPLISREQWDREVEPAMRAVYLSGTEGLPMPTAERFAREFAAAFGTHYARLTPHGTDAIMAALMAALDLEDWGPGGEVIMPDYTFSATASAAIYLRCSVAMVDIDPRTFTISPEAVESAIIPGKTRAILPVHLTGHPADMDAIHAIARKHDLKVIEDCAQAHGAMHNGRHVGGLGDAGAFSFQSTKNLSSGEGGAVTTNDPKIDQHVAAIMNSGRAPKGARWEYPRIGWNFRPSEYIAALLSVRLRRLEQEAQHREKIADILSQRLANIRGVTPPCRAPWCTRHAYHLYAVLIDPQQFGGRPRDQIVVALQAEGIPCSAGYTRPLSQQKGFANLAQRHPDAIRVLPCPNIAATCQRTIWLAQELLLAGEQDMREIAEALAKVQAAMGR